MLANSTQLANLLIDNERNLSGSFQEVTVEFLFKLYNSFYERMAAEKTCYSDATNIIYQEKLKTVEAHKKASKKPKDKVAMTFFHYYYESLKSLNDKTKYGTLSRRIRNAHFSGHNDPIRNIMFNVRKCSTGNYLVKSNLYEDVWLPLVTDPLSELDMTKKRHTDLVIEELSQLRELMRDTGLNLFTWDLSLDVVHFTKYERLPHELRMGEL